MFCRNCGEQIRDDACVCPKCRVSMFDTGSVGWGVLGFLIPPLGLILHIAWLVTKPLNAHITGKGALIGLIFYIVSTVITVIIEIALVSSITMSAALSLI